MDSSMSSEEEFYWDACSDSNPESPSGSFSFFDSREDFTRNGKSLDRRWSHDDSRSRTGLHVRHRTKFLLGRIERKISANSFFLTNYPKALISSDLAATGRTQRPSPIVEEVMTSAAFQLKKQAKRIFEDPRKLQVCDFQVLK